MLFIITGKSGSGKTAIANKLPIERIKTVTSRPTREKEIIGKDYYFVSGKKFKELIDKDLLAEWELFAGNYYGIFRVDLLKIDQIPKSIILDYKGAKKLKDMFPEKVRWVNIEVDPLVVNNRLLERDGTINSLRVEQEENNSNLLQFVDKHLYNNGCLMNTVVQLSNYITVESWGY